MKYSQQFTILNYPIEYKFIIGQGKIMLFAGDIQPIGIVISHSPSYAEWLITNQDLLQLLFDNDTWFISPEHTDDEIHHKYWKELLIHMKKLESLLDLIENNKEGQ